MKYIALLKDSRELVCSKVMIIYSENEEQAELKINQWIKEHTYEWKMLEPNYELEYIDKFENLEIIK